MWISSTKTLFTEAISQASLAKKHGTVSPTLLCCVVLIVLRCVALRCVALRCVALRCVALRYVSSSSFVGRYKYQASHHPLKNLCNCNCDLEVQTRAKRRNNRRRKSSRKKG